MTAEACRDCLFATGGPGEGHCCGGQEAVTMRSERAVLAAGGLAIALVSLAVLTVGSSRHVTVLVALVPTVVLGTVLAVQGAVALHRRDRTSDALVGAGVRLLPLAVLGLLATVGLAALRFVLTG